MAYEPISKAISRRALLRQGAVYLTAAAAGRSLEAANAPEAALPAVRVGLLTDTHYAEAPARGSRHYRLSLGKVRQAAAHMNRLGVQVAVELGDLIDAADPPDQAREERFLESVCAEMAKLKAGRHFVLGNHCVWNMTKNRFLEIVRQPKSFYSFDRSGIHFIVLDACFRKDGTPYGERNFEWTDTEIPPEERSWLAEDLKAARGQSLVFVHQRLDLVPGNHYAVASTPEVRSILESSHKVRAVFQGHSHENAYSEIEGIHYITLAAMVEGNENAYAAADIYPDGTIRLQSFHRAAGHPFESF
ncbi:MAG: metallophosphoesterase [Armatimonadetes bacterium]|nr:metallophosphoesterase [Armatimonadota bacterium]